MTKYPSQMTVGRTIDLVAVCLGDVKQHLVVLIAPADARALAADLVAAANEIDNQAQTKPQPQPKYIGLVDADQPDALAMIAELDGRVEEVADRVKDIEAAGPREDWIAERLSEIDKRISALEIEDYTPNQGWLAQVLNGLDKRLKAVELEAEARCICGEEFVTEQLPDGCWIVRCPKTTPEGRFFVVAKDSRDAKRQARRIQDNMP